MQTAPPPGVLAPRRAAGLQRVGDWARDHADVLILAAIVVAGRAARELFSKRAALIAAALVAASPDLFWYSQEARSYPVFIFLTATALYFFARALRRPSRGAFIGWAIASGLALATHYFS